MAVKTTDLSSHTSFVCACWGSLPSVHPSRWKVTGNTLWPRTCPRLYFCSHTDVTSIDECPSYSLQTLNVFGFGLRPSWLAFTKQCDIQQRDAVTANFVTMLLSPLFLSLFPSLALTHLSLLLVNSQYPCFLYTPVGHTVVCPCVCFNKTI